MSASVALWALLWIAVSSTPSELRRAAEQLDEADPEAALATLDHAQTSSTSDADRAQIELLRARSFAALRRYDRAEQALLRAVEADPTVSLDPEHVDPTLVALLQGVKNRAQGELRVDAPEGTTITLDGKPVEGPPFQSKVPAGAHHLTLERAGALEQRDVVIRPGAMVDLQAFPAPAPSAHPAVAPVAVAPTTPRADLHLLLGLRGTATTTGGLAPGLSIGWWRGPWSIELGGVWGAVPGLSVRGRGEKRLGESRWAVHAAVDGMVFTSTRPFVGVGVAAGPSFQLAESIELFAEVGAQQFGPSAVYRPRYAVGGVGVHWRL